MTEAALGLLVFSLIIIFCVRNFFIQLVVLKLFLDVIVLLISAMRGPGQNQAETQATAWLVTSIGTLVFFIIMAAGIRRFAKARTLDVDESVGDLANE